MPAGDKQQPFSVKKMALRELQNENANIVPEPPGTSVVAEDKAVGRDSAKTLGAKRQQTDGPSSSPVYQNVYVRRKVDNEQSKLSPSQETKKIGREGTKENDVDHNQIEEPKMESPIPDSGGTGSSVSLENPTTAPALPEPENPTTPPAVSEPEKPTTTAIVPEPEKPSTPPAMLESEKTTTAPSVPEPEKPTTRPAVPEPEKPTTRPAVIGPGKPTTTPAVPELENPTTTLAVLEPIELPVVSVTIPRDDFQRSSSQYWKERYARLQAYLENCDRSSQEYYIRNLRCLSAVGRSKHAFELEKRAIQLLLEEGKELQRMKVLNVLGKATPNDASPESAQTPLQRWYQN